MASRTIETKAIISAEDKTGPAFAAVVQHMAKMEEAARHAQTRVQVAATAEGQTGMIAREQRRADLREERRARQEEVGHLRQVQRMHEDLSGRKMALGMAGAAIAEQTAHFAHQSLETYREFDKERRYGKAVMGISDDDQADLVRQAIHLGATTKFNDIQVLDAQRELAARGLHKEQIIGMMSAAADLGQSMDLSLPDAVKQMEGAIFGFKKSIATTGDAMASARQTADVQVRAAKMSGMTPEDIKETYKYGATPARLSGVSEQTLLAFGGISKKANMGGSEAGTAFRALMSTANAPTRGAKEAMLANGLDYSKYQKKIDHIDVEPFARNVAAQYGVKLSKSAINGLTKAFSDPKVLNDPALFTPAVTQILSGVLKGKDAKSLKSIAGMANRFRSASGGGADVDAFLLDMMVKMGSGKGGIQLANAVFGAKQGGRIANALGDPETLKGMIALLKDHSQGYAEKVAAERMAGFDGAVSRFEGAVKNLESALPRAFDANGKGGLLTGVADAMGRFTQSLAEAPPAVQRLATEAGLAAAAFAGFKGAEALMGGFGLKGAAVELMEAARMLMGAAGGHSLEGLAGGAGKETKAVKTIGGRILKVAKNAAVIGTVIEAGNEVLDYLHDKDVNEFGKGVDNPVKTYTKHPMGGNAHAASFGRSPYGGLRGAADALRQGTAGFAPIGALSAAPTMTKVDTSVKIEPPPPLDVKVTVEAASTLIEIANKLQSLQVQLKAQASTRTDNGPGGLGETHTGQ